MFEEFGRGSHKQENRRFGVSLAASSLVYLGLFGTAVAASAAVRQAVVEEDLTQVEFALPDEPEPPPPVEAPPPPKPKPKPAAVALPDAIPEEKLEESDAPLAEAPPPGPEEAAPEPEPEPAPVVEAAPPPPKPKAPAGPIQVPEDATPASALPGNAPVEYPEEARKNGVQGEVIAKLVISNTGEVLQVDILRGPEIFATVVKSRLLTWRFEPARLPDGTAFASFKIIRLPFKLENM